MHSLKNLLKDVQENNADDFKRGAGGPTGDWDRLLPEEQEYRAKIVAAKYAPSKSSGVPQATITLQIFEPEEYEGCMLQGHYQMPATTEASQRQFSQLMGALNAPIDGFADDDYEGYVQSWVGYELRIAVSHWGEANDRNGLRWANANTPGNLRTNIKPPKKKVDTQALRPDVVIPKAEEEAPAATPPVAAEQPQAEPAPTPAQTTSLPGGVNLPPGLRG